MRLMRRGGSRVFRCGRGQLHAFKKTRALLRVHNGGRTVRDVLDDLHERFQRSNLRGQGSGR